MNTKEFMAKFRELGKIADRICESSEDCASCILYPKYSDNGDFSFCEIFPECENEWDRLSMLIDGLQNWADEHRGKTYKDDFLEKYPDATIQNEMPVLCRNALYKEKQNKCTVGCLYIEECAKCWNEPLPENKNSK